MVTLKAGLILTMSSGFICHQSTCNVGSEGSNNKQGSLAMSPQNSLKLDKP